VPPDLPAAVRLVSAPPGVRMLPPRGFITAPEDFTAWANGRKHLRLEDFYRYARRLHNILINAERPEGGVWNLDTET
jgi:deoxyribodipyrimidine photolyase-related protein